MQYLPIFLLSITRVFVWKTVPLYSLRVTTLMQGCCEGVLYMYGIILMQCPSYFQGRNAPGMQESGVYHTVCTMMTVEWISADASRWGRGMGFPDPARTGSSGTVNARVYREYSKSKSGDKDWLASVWPMVRKSIGICLVTKMKTNRIMIRMACWRGRQHHPGYGALEKNAWPDRYVPKDIKAGAIWRRSWGMRIQPGVPEAF